MSHRIRTAALVAIAVAAAPAIAQPGGEMTPPSPSGTIAYGANDGPTSETSIGPTTTGLFPPSSVKQLYDNWWFYRVQGDTRERPFGTYTKSDGFTITGTSIWPPNGDGRTASYAWTENGPGGPRFTAADNMVLSGGTTPYDVRLDQTFQITNPNSTPLTIALYNFTRWSPSGDVTTNVAATGGVTSISVTDGLYDDTHSATGATAFQAAQAPALASILTDGSVNDLNDSGLPYSGNNFADAFEWTLTIPPDGSMSVEASLAVTHAVPEPSALVLMGSAASLAAALRRRRRTNVPEKRAVDGRLLSPTTTCLP